MARPGHKYIFVLGGVMSGVGKGIASSSMGLLLQARGYKVNLVKVDPYLNVDAGTMNPTEHGEVFVLKSGLETDQDMGNYERFLNRDLGPEDYMTSGMVYQTVIARERALEYGGATIEAIPHVRDEILRRIEAAANEAESQISVIEIGGTVGDFQNALFIEAARLLRLQFPDDVAFVMVSYLPVPGTLGEMKTKPTQSAVRELNSYGVQPDFIVARSTHAMDEKRKEKLAIACSVRPDRIISAPDVESIYDVPLNFERDSISDLLLDKLRLPKDTPASLDDWRTFVQKMKADRPKVKIGIVGKYFDTGDYVLSDAYLSIIEALKFSGAEIGVKPEIIWLNAKEYERGAAIEGLSEYDGILVPGGFGESGIEGKLKAIQYARENKIPYFGICYGMQLMVVEYARNVLGLADAHTTEINPDTANPIVAIMDAQKKHMAEKNYGGTMRLGTYVEMVKPGTIAHEAYGSDSVEERHRHRYEINPAYVQQMEEAGMVFSGTSPDGVLMEIAELPREAHPFMLGTQAHPELQARPLDPHPLFTKFLEASLIRAQER
ncbi:MAG: pyrG [Parcubacteria group bacterium]|nr:pyrG [Parcubacteria group bacterium]